MKKIFSVGLLAIFIISLLFTACKNDDDVSFSEETDSILNILSERVEKVMIVAGEAFEKTNSPDEINKYLNDIMNIEGVKDVYNDDHAFYVNVEGWGVIPYIYPDIVMTNNDVSRQYNYDCDKKSRTVIDKIENDHKFSEAQSVCIINQQAGDDIVNTLITEEYLGLNIETKSTSISQMTSYFNDCGYSIKTFEGSEVTKEVYANELFKYDLVFILTHGCYDWKSEKKHWLLTGEKYDVLEHGWLKKFIRNIWFNDDEIKKINEVELEEFLNLTKTQIRIAGVKETHNGVKSRGYFAMISEDYINNSNSNFNNTGAIVYNCACQSLTSNDNLAKAFFKRGAACYLGWTESDCRGSHGGKLFYGNMLNGKSVNDAYEAIPASFSKTPNEGGAFLDLVCNPKIKNSSSICITRPKRYDAKVNKISETDFKVELTGELNLLDLDINENEERSFGFFTSTDKDMSIKNYHPGTRMNGGHTFTFLSTLNVDHLKPNTTYYYMAYLYDGEHYCLSDTASFTTPDVSRIKHIVPDDILSIMSPHIPIYDGANPPFIESLYLISPMILTYNSNPSGNYKPGKQVIDMFIYFSEQDVMTNTLNYYGFSVNSYGEVSEEEVGPGAFISGEGDNFSVFFNTEGVSHYSDGDATYKEALIISGTKTILGIKDLYYAFVMIEKNDPNNHMMKTGEFRVFVDNDGIADLIELNTTRNINKVNSILLPNCADEDVAPTYRGFNIWKEMRTTPDISLYFYKRMKWIQDRL